MNLIPSVVHQLATYPQLGKYDLSSITNMSSGAAYLPPDLADKLLSRLGSDVDLGEGRSLHAHHVRDVC